VKIEVLRSWTPAADAVLAALPADPDWPHDIYRGLATLPNQGTRVVLGWEGDRPVGLIAFQRETVRVWVPVTHWVLPGLVGIAEPEILQQMLERLPFPARVAWWRMQPETPRVSGRIRSVHSEPTLGISLKADFEAYWKKTGCLRDVRRAERGSSRFELRVNAPGALEWIIRNSERKWREVPEVETPRTANHLFASAEAQRFGRYIALTLSEGDVFVAGQSLLVHRGDLVCTSTYRDPRFDAAAPGNAILARAFYWGRDQGYSELDLGGGYDYKRRWVPVHGTKASVHVLPPLSYIGANCAQTARAIGVRALRLVRRAPGEVAANG